jgi:hypothetical protein
MTIFNEKKSWFLGLGLKFEVFFRIGFYILELNIKMQQELFHWLRNAKQLNICNLTKENEIHERKLKKITKQNFTLDETRNFAFYFVSRNKRNFAK